MGDGVSPLDKDCVIANLFSLCVLSLSEAVTLWCLSLAFSFMLSCVVLKILTSKDY